MYADQLRSLGQPLDPQPGGAAYEPVRRIDIPFNATAGELNLGGPWRYLLLVDCIGAYLTINDDAPKVVSKSRFVIDLLDTRGFIRRAYLSWPSSVIGSGQAFLSQVARVDVTLDAQIVNGQALALPLRSSVATSSNSLVVAARANRRALFLQGDRANVGIVSLVLSGVADVTYGLELGPGETLVFPTTAAVYGYQTSGSTCYVRVCEVY